MNAARLITSFFAAQRTLAWFLGLSIYLTCSTAHPHTLVGKKAPWFRLKSLTGKEIDSKQILGKTTILVVGRTQKSAPACKKWMYEILKHHGAEVNVLQIIVTDNPWYIPRSLVIKKIEGFVSPKQRHRVLIEWYTVFADAYRIPKQDDPTIILIDNQGVVRWNYRGALSSKSWKMLTSMLKRHLS